MTDTKYFILTKNCSKPIYDNSDDQIISLNNSLSFLLPCVDLCHYSSFGLYESD